MGEAKKRGDKFERIASARDKALGNNPFEVAYDAIFGMIEMVYGQTGGINHELIGLEFKEGKVSGVNVLLIENSAAIDRIPDNIESMLLKWSVVAHVMEAWEAPPDGTPANVHPDRKDIIGIALHSLDGAMLAACEVDPLSRSIRRGELRTVERLEGRLGRKFETRH
jgi:hypothetical protein